MSTSSIWSARRTTASGTVSCWAMPVICSTTSLRLSRCWMLTVLSTLMPGGEDVLDVLPALLVARAGRVGVRQLVHDDHVGMPGEHRVDVELGQVTPRWVSSLRGRTSRPAAAQRCAVGRGSRRSRRRRRCPGTPAGAPRRAWRRSSRRPGRRPGRCGGVPRGTGHMIVQIRPAGAVAGVKVSSGSGSRLASGVGAPFRPRGSTSRRRRTAAMRPGKRPAAARGDHSLSGQRRDTCGCRPGPLL